MKANKSTNTRRQQIRELAEQDLLTFIKLVHPNRVLGPCHVDVVKWWNRPEAKSHQLLLLPRDHQKSALAAYRAAWEITKNPAIRVLYISSTQNLAVKQLKFIKDILTSDIYRFYWPEMVHPEEAKREKWTESEISVDHPKRKQEIVRDPTVFTAGLTTTITGLHCDLAILDDVVVDDNAYNEIGREKVRSQASYLASIAGADSRMWAVGTRYHPQDLYNDFTAQVVELFNEDGEVYSSEALWETFERQVETNGDGTGEYLWPRTQRYDGKWFGFNQEVLARKKAQYSDLTRFRAQYYNNPNDLSQASIQPDFFQYYNRALLKQENGKWYFKGKRLNVFAAVDFAYSLARRADYSCVTVVGVDSDNNYYVLDIVRFKTTKISDYFDHILRLHTKWDFRKLRAEVTAAQAVIVEDLKSNYIRPHGLALSIEDFRPTRNQGTKEERIEAILQPKYANRQIWHYQGGNSALLEEELVMQKPPHDDIKDCLASCIDSCIPPSSSGNDASTRSNTRIYNYQQFVHGRFGGIG
jgi:hypothetical protein